MTRLPRSAASLPAGGASRAHGFSAHAHRSRSRFRITGEVPSSPNSNMSWTPARATGACAAPGASGRSSTTTGTPVPVHAPHTVTVRSRRTSRRRTRRQRGGIEPTPAIAEPGSIPDLRSSIHESEWSTPAPTVDPRSRFTRRTSGSRVGSRVPESTPTPSFRLEPVIDHPHGAEIDVTRDFC